jgi:FixJ family two-component response regulator/DNA-binding MarR family transcriptional regulator
MSREIGGSPGGERRPVPREDEPRDKRLTAILPAAPGQPNAVFRDNQRSFAVMTLVAEPRGLAEVPELLKSDGFRVEPGRDADHALRLVVERAEIGIVVCDMLFGELRGHQFYQQVLARLPAERPMSVVFLAEAASINDVVAAMRLQAVDFLRKPANPASLCDAVRRADRMMLRRATERAMMRRATDLLEAMRAVIDGLPGQPLAVEDDTGPGGSFEDMLAVSTETEEALALGRRKKELRRVAGAMKAQRLQRKMFGTDLVANPCWDMLLDLYEKMLLERPVSVSSLALASGVPVTTALRRMAKLQDLGYVRRDRDAGDARRVLVELTERGMRQLEQYLEAID